jgi:hypothetical protein
MRTLDSNELPTCPKHQLPIRDRAGNEVPCPDCADEEIFSFGTPADAVKKPVAKKFGDRIVQAMPTPDSRYVDLPPLEAGFVRVLTSVNHKIWDVLVASLSLAREYDAKIRILQV